MNIRTTLKRHQDSLVMIMVTVVIFLGLAISPVFAATPRVPQVAFNTAPLQGYFSSVGEPGIDPATMQVDAQVWNPNLSGNSDFTIVMSNSPGAEIGVYNAADPLPSLDAVFPSGAVEGWHAYLNFTVSGLTVRYFDETNTMQGQVNYANVTKATPFGFYIKKGNAVFYSQDARNVAGAEILTYAGIVYGGDWFLCFEDGLASPASTYDKVVLEVQSLRPTPTSNSTWGNIKSRYR